MQKLSFRLATRDDISTILSLSIGGNAPGRAIVDDVNEAGNADYQTAWDQIDADPNNNYFIAELEGEAVGCLQLNIIHGIAGRGKSRLQVEGVHIRADKRGQGFGGQMMRWAIDYGQEKGARMVQLTSSKSRPDAHRFYDNLGFERSHEGFKLAL